MENSKDIVIFCQNVKILRERNGLSRKEMAEIMGIGLKSLDKLEQNILPSRITVSAIKRLSQYFKIKPHELFICL